MLPVLEDGELGYCTRNDRLYIGTASGVNEMVNPPYGIEAALEYPTTLTAAIPVAWK